MAFRSWTLPAPGRDRLGRYRLRYEIGRGGMGAVYLAALDGPDGFRKWVAVKTLVRDVPVGEPAARMFLDEARVASLLQHPNIAQVHELGRDDDGSPFLAMEYVHGEHLGTVMAAGGRLPDRLAVWLAAQICDALVYAHELRVTGGERLGLVHRDISPQNILISYDGVPKLVDFGIARASLRMSESETGVVKGRLGYMPPEQRLGRSVDARADLFALGVVLYEATVGRHPWTAPADLAAEAPPPPRPTERADYPEPLWRVIERCTQPDPDSRFAGARDMLVTLRAVAETLGPPVSRDDLAGVVAERLAERRAAKDRLLEHAETGITEILPAPGAGRVPSTPSVPPERAGGEARPPRSRRLALAAGAVLLLAAAIAVVAVRRSGSGAAVAATGSVRLCILAEPHSGPEAHDATWMLVRLIARALANAPGIEPLSGFRGLDRFGWSVDGAARARRVCESVGADAFLTVRAEADGAVAAELEAREPHHLASPGPPIRAAAGLATAVVIRLGGPRTWAPAMPVLPTGFGSLLRLLRVREHVAMHDYARAREHVDSAIREDPTDEDAYLYRALIDWLTLALDVPDHWRTIAPPVGSSFRVVTLMEAIHEQALGNSQAAAERALAVLQDRRYRDDPIALYVAGEALFHGQRPADGIHYLQRALEVDPDLRVAAYHLESWYTAAADWERLEALASAWERADPSDWRALELRSRIGFGQRRYRDAAAGYERVIVEWSGETAANLSGPDIGLIYARALAGDVDGALAHAERAVSDRQAVKVAWVMVEPVAYALCRWRQDLDCARRWEERIRAQLHGPPAAATLHLAYFLAVVDMAGGVADPRRWVGAAKPPEVPRSYRFADHARLLEVLEWHRDARRDQLEQATTGDGDPAVRQLARGLAAELAGEPRAAAEAFHAALASTRDGEFDCIAAAALARVHRTSGDRAGADAACERVLWPSVPRAYCIALWPQCGRSP